MRASIPSMPRTWPDRLRWAIADAWTVARRDLIHWFRQPFGIVVTLLFPVMLVLMFGYLFGGAMSVPGEGASGGGDYREFLLPGMFAMTMAFGLEATMTSVATDAARGVTDRFRSMPMAPSAVVLGRSMADMLNSLLGLSVMVACGLLVRWRWNGVSARRCSPWAAALAAVLAVMGRDFSGPRRQESRGRGGGADPGVARPLPLQHSSWARDDAGWLGAISEWNPLSATVAATRELFGNPGWGGETWAARNALLMAVLWPLVIFAVFFPLSVWRYRRLSH